jgi:imidazole glycerol phosphate synthase glutamine amidotransferase subunit
MVVIVDYGMGNLKSVANAARSLGKKVRVSDSPNTLKRAKKIIFPGVGHFGRTVQELKKRKIFEVLKAKISQGTPYLGICIGMQVLFDASEEAPGLKGLGLIPGKVKRFKNKGLIVPHMGWNQIKLKGQGSRGKDIFRGVKDKSFFYFVHSYYCEPKDKKVVLSKTKYGLDFASSIHQDNIWALQFHAEKSQKLGLKVFDNFLELC